MALWEFVKRMAWAVGMLILMQAAFNLAALVFGL